MLVEGCRTSADPQNSRSRHFYTRKDYGMKHTQGKLRTYLHSFHGPLLVGGDEQLVAEAQGWNKRTNEEREANAARLAHCWNCHDELVACLDEIHDLPADDEGVRTIPAGFLDRTRAALKAAEGGAA